MRRGDLDGLDVLYHTASYQPGAGLSFSAGWVDGDDNGDEDDDDGDDDDGNDGDGDDDGDYGDYGDDDDPIICLPIHKSISSSSSAIR